MKNKELAIAQLKDPKFYLENFCKIKGKKPGQLLPFVLKECQKDLFNTVRNFNRVILLKARQLGMSSAMCGYFYHNTITNPGTTTALIGYNSDLTAELLDKVKLFHKSTPPELRPTVHYNTKYEISFPKIDSKILVLPSTEYVGRGYTLSNALCVSGDTKIFLADGIQKKVKELQAGEFIVNGNGGLSKVKKVITKSNTDPMVRLNIYGTDDLVVTPDHKVLTRDPKNYQGVWKEAQDITEKDYIAYPYFQCRNRVKNIVMEDVNFGNHGGYRKKVNLNIKIDYNFGLFVGWYLAEGSARKSQISLSVHKKEVPQLLNLIQNSIVGNISSFSVSYSNDSKTAIIHLYGRNFAHFMSTTFGRISLEKTINDKVWYWGWSFGKGLIFGLFSGDGYFGSPKNDCVILTNTSPQLIYQTKKLLVSLRIGLAGIRHCDSYRYGKKGRHRYDLMLTGKGNYKFRRIFGLELPVYNNGRARWMLENIPGANQGHSRWRKGKFHYWARIKKIIIDKPEPEVYDIVLPKNPHSFLTVSGVVKNCTELAFWEKPEEKMQTLEASVPIDGKLVIESTPAGVGNLYHRIWQSDNDYIKKMYGWWWEYTKEELDVIRKRMNNPRKFSQEFLCEFLSSGRPVFDMGMVKKQRSNIWNIGTKIKLEDGNWFQVKSDEGWTIYKPPTKDGLYIFGIDVSEGVDGGAESAAVVWDRKTGEEVAMYHGYIPPDRYADVLDRKGRWYNNALMVVEINNHGLTTVTGLKKKLYPSLYFRPSKFDNVAEKVTTKIGWKTTAVTRPLLIDDFGQAVRDENLKIHSKALLDQMMVFIYNDNGEMEAQSGYMDDIIFAAGIGFQGFKVLYDKPLTQINYNQHLPNSSPY